ncbi:MAG: hypothetical protein LBM09_02435 [Candidatus Nomurabacteria bacterium]|nr:hypothetical protein [Candidatus Nomurabacteria bacterium]
MANSGKTPISSGTDKLVKKMGLSQLFLVTIHVISVAVAAQVAIAAVVSSIFALTTGGEVGGVMAFVPFAASFVASVLILTAVCTAKKITDKETLKKGYSIAAAILTLDVIVALIMAIAVIPFALFAIGVGGSFQKVLWLNTFLPLLGSAAVAAAVLVIVKKLKDGMAKILPILNYIVLGVSAVALVLSIIAAFVGFYAKDRCESYNNFDSYSEYIDECLNI